MRRINRLWLALVTAAVAAPGAEAAQAGTPKAPDPKQALIARAKALELNTPYVPPPGDALSHHTSGFAKVMCSAVFITGLDPNFAAENVGYFSAPYAERAKVGKPVVDRAAKTVSVKLPNGVVRIAQYTGDGAQGCVTYPEGKTTLNFKPVQIASAQGDPSAQP